MNVTLLPEDEQLYEVDLYVFVILLSFYCSISILAIVGNGFVIWTVCTTRHMKNATNYYIANLAVADILIAMFVIPFQFQAALLQQWNLPRFMCAFCPSVRIISITVSVLSLSAIAVDRHRAITNPLRPRPSRKLSLLVIVCIWSLAALISWPTAYANEVIMIDGHHHGISIPFCFHQNLSEAVMRTYNILLVVMQYVLPLSIISWAYWGMGVSLWGASAPGNAQESRDAAILRKKKKVIKMLIVVVAIFALCWLPLQMYNVLQYFIPLNSYQYINVLWFMFDWLAMSNSCYNPFIYVLYNANFKREFQRRLGKFWPFKTNMLIRDLSTLSSNSYSWQRDTVRKIPVKAVPRSQTLTKEPLLPV